MGKDGRVEWEDFLLLMRDRRGVDALVAEEKKVRATDDRVVCVVLVLVLVAVIIAGGGGRDGVFFAWLFFFEGEGSWWRFRSDFLKNVGKISYFCPVGGTQVHAVPMAFW